LHGKSYYIENFLTLKKYWYLKWHALKNWLDSKTSCIKNLYTLKNRFKHPKRRRTKNMVREIFTYMYAKCNYKKVTKKL
jgi:hypothetical protein